MTYHEKELDQIKHRISRACSMLSTIGFISGMFGLMSAMFECWNGDPYSRLTIATGVVGVTLIYTAAYIGNQINRK